MADDADGIGAPGGHEAATEHVAEQVDAGQGAATEQVTEQVAATTEQVDAGQAVDAEPDIGFDDAGGEDETPTVRRLREQVREGQRQLKELRRAPPATGQEDPEPVVPARPTLEQCDYDPERFERATDQWLEARDRQREWHRTREDQQRAIQRRQEEQAQAVARQRDALGVSDYDEMSARVRDALSDQQIAILVDGADNPAQLIYALGRSPGRLDALSAIGNMAKFAAQVGKLERDVKVKTGSTGSRQVPAPESRVRGATAGGAAASSAKTLEQLEREADRTGDRSAVIAYKRAQRASGAA